MKKAYILVASLALLVFLSVFMLANIHISSYAPRFAKDMKLYTQAEILGDDAPALARYFLQVAKNQGKDCLSFVEFNYPQAPFSQGVSSKNTKKSTTTSTLDTSKGANVLRFDFFYPLKTCENGLLRGTNADTNLSANAVVLVNFSALLNANTAVNEEVFLNRKFVLYETEK